jgi:hypothetical protein
VRVRVVRLPHGVGLALPSYQTKGAAGLDLLAALDTQRPLTLAPGARALVPTGLVRELPQGYEGQVRPRSGLALNYGIAVLNSGTIDAITAARCASYGQLGHAIRDPPRRANRPARREPRDTGRACRSGGSLRHGAWRRRLRLYRQVGANFNRAIPQTCAKKEIHALFRGGAQKIAFAEQRGP